MLSFNSNIMAVNANRNLSHHFAGLAGSVRRLSSGLRVGTAADDAAGLAIRELMRTEVASNNQGVRNVNDSISLLQTAEGSLQIVDEKLLRMKELAEQAATGTYNSDQRLMIDAEYQQMAREITRIGNTTEFNGIVLLNGGLERAYHDGSGLTSLDNNNGRMDGSSTVAGLMSGGHLKIHFGSGNDSAEDYYYIQIIDTTCIYLNLGDEFGLEATAANEMVRPFLLGTEGQLRRRIEPDDRPLTPEEIASDYYITKEEYAAVLEEVKASAEAFMREAVLGFDSDANFQTAFEETFGAAIVPRDSSFIGPEGLGYTYLEGMDAADYSVMHASYNALTGGEKEKYQYALLRNSIRNMRDSLIDGSIFDPALTPDADLRIDVEDKLRRGVVRAGVANTNAFLTHHTYAGRNIETQHHAQIALGAVDRAMLKTEYNRAHIGALQNRLENTASNLQIQTENLQASESRISDADVAVEMTAFVRGQILAQAAVSMLAQANSIPRFLLSLLS